MKATELLGSLGVVPALDKVGRSVVSGRGTLLRSGAAASAVRQRTVST